MNCFFGAVALSNGIATNLGASSCGAAFFPASSRRNAIDILATEALTMNVDRLVEVQRALMAHGQTPGAINEVVVQHDFARSLTEDA